MNVKNLLENFYSTLKLIDLQRTAAGMLYWDRDTLLGMAGQEYRAEQVAYLAKQIHILSTSSELADTVAGLKENLSALTEEDQINVIRFDYDLKKQNKLPADFVEYEAKVCSQSQGVWTQAKPDNDFNAVKNHLQEIVKLTKERARINNDFENPYDSILDYYEEGFTQQDGDQLLLPLGDELAKLIPQVLDKQKNDKPIDQKRLSLSRRDQEDLIKNLAQKLEFTGIISESSHPFSICLGPEDNRVTVRYNESDLTDAVSNATHEIGHGLYDQGLRKEYFGTPLASPCSVGVNESQSRFWENIVGRSLPFQLFLHNMLGKYYTSKTKVPSAQLLFCAQNKVQKSLIRIYADEATYNLHIIIRYTLEKNLMSDNLQVKDLPSAWNDLYEKYLDITPPSDREGVLQDVHWYSGMIGYFPTYTLGNIYSAIIYKKLREDIKDFDQLVEQGEFGSILKWLNINIHRHGRKYLAKDLISSFGAVQSDDFVNYLKNKLL